MYCTHYGFSEKPFDVTPEPRFLYMAPDHRETLASLIYGIRERRGFIVVVGEVGTGKTTLLNAALDRLDPNIKTAFIFNTSVTFEQLLHMVIHELGLAEFSERLPVLDAIHRLNRLAVRQLARGGSVALIIDEAQNLSNDALENLRMLSNLETRKHKLVQIVLSGQPELEAKLARHELRQLTQRISLRRYITPLNENDTYAYIQHRLKRVNYTGSSLFTRNAQRLIWKYSGGIPRKINMLCDNALLIGYGLKQKKIHVETIQEVITDLAWDRSANFEASDNPMPAGKMSPGRRPKSRRRTFAWAAALIIAIPLFFAGGFYLGRPKLHSPGDADFVDTEKSRVGIRVQSMGTTGSTQLDKPVLPKQQVVAQQAEAMTHPIADDKTERYPIDQAKDLTPRDEVIDQKAEVSIESTAEEKPQDRAIYRPTENFRDFPIPKTVLPENTIASDTKIVTNLSEKETVNSPSTHSQIINSTGKIEINEIVAVSTIPIETDIKSRQVRVQSGKNLYRIIIERCGTYNDVLLTEVLEENPDITDLSRILAGQVITLPVSCVQKVD